MSALAFEDVHEFPGNGDFYATPNEELSHWETLLQGLKLYNVAGICSGGEVGFFNLLPRVQRKLVLVDHSYQALAFAALKYLALQKYGAEETYKRLTEAPATDPYHRSSPAYQALVEEFGPLLPPPLVQCGRKLENSASTGYTLSTSFQVYAYQIARFWKQQKPEPLIKTCAKLHKVHFVHGDLTDLARFGKFGAVYLSNALESNHHNRNRTTSIPEQVAQCLKPEGYVLASHSASRYTYRGGRPPYPSNWELLNSIKPTVRTPGELGWTYNLLQVHPVAA